MTKPKKTEQPVASGQGGLSHALQIWTQEITHHLPSLSAPQARVLALWSVGMILAQASGLTAVTLYLATGLKKKTNTVRQQLREFYYEAAAKRGAERQELVVEHCCADLLGWVLARWEATHLALALDATSLGQRFTVLVVSVVYRGCAIPVAWVVLPMLKKEAWRGYWLRLLRQVRRAVPAGWTVVVLADRGLYAKWLFRRIRRLKWHPLLRVNKGGTFCPDGETRYRSLASFAPQYGTQWSGTGVAFKTPQARLRCTLLAWWEEGYDDPWLVLTDLPPENANVLWYGLRAWIERGFKLLKRAGWQWQATRMTDAERATRLWLALAVATLWLVSVGGAAEAEIELATVPELLAVKCRRSGTRWRTTGIFQRGAVLILLALINQESLPLGHFYPEPWPHLEAVSTSTAHALTKCAGASP